MAARVVAGSVNDYNAYIASVRRPVVLGGQEWRGVCAKCHGIAGKGGYGPAIQNNSVLVEHQGLLRLLENGQNTRKPLASYMPPVGRGWTDAQVKALEAYLILTADHGMNASTFAARVATSTAADAGAALVTAVATLSGPLHGGAPGPVLDMLDAIQAPEDAQGWISAELSAGRRLMGFGHRVYRVDDPRAMALREVAIALGGARVELARAVEQEALGALAESKPSRPLRTNVEFWTALVLERCGIPRSAFSLTFTSSRMAGWTAHIVEQVRDNRLIRPTSTYLGPSDRKL
jgi:citrate synthase